MGVKGVISKSAEERNSMNGLEGRMARVYESIEGPSMWYLMTPLEKHELYKSEI